MTHILDAFCAAARRDRNRACPPWPQQSRPPAEIKRLELIAPANPGGGWDQTARAMQTVLQENGLASGVQVQNVPGAGGTIGLAQFVTTKKRKGDVILVAGQTLQGAIITNKRRSPWTRLHRLRGSSASTRSSWCRSIRRSRRWPTWSRS